MAEKIERVKLFEAWEQAKKVGGKSSMIDVIIAVNADDIITKWRKVKYDEAKRKRWLDMVRLY